ncbi:MAG: Succinylglutamate desuccinylase/aspartoacylase [Parcubacteria group bacterium GW2011_GWA2_47_16]|nr:MAG: Succinylglutamate desuccinylase/aspartoacylase [Parcubacteria group bacterium GW2011_GWA2_47_16]
MLKWSVSTKRLWNVWFSVSWPEPCVLAFFIDVQYIFIMPPIYNYKSKKAGPHVLFFGAIHGRETCGTVALKKLADKISAGSLRLQKGSVTCVPVCNPKAFSEGERYCEENLNRVFKRHKHPKSYEAKLANALIGVVDRCDVLVDIHSYSASSTPFVFLDYGTKASRHLAESVGIPKIIKGWAALYGRVEEVNPKQASYDTARYAHEHGKVSLTVECGKHHSVSAERVAYRTVLNTLKHFGIIAGRRAGLKTVKQKLFQLDRVYFKDSAEDVLAKCWKNFEPVSRGQAIARRADGSVIAAPYQGFVVLPKQNPPVGDEWFYLAKSE